ncbi:MAG: dipeptidase [Clostridia bacterium]|nr:dipeptidase [Clostridia bacterium]
MKYMDMHCDTITIMYQYGGELKKNSYHIDIEKMKKGECLLQNFAVFTDITKNNSSYTRDNVRFFHSEMEKNRDSIRQVLKFSDIKENEKNGLISAMLTLEDSGIIDNDLRNMEWFYNEGVRMMTLTWNYYNGIGYPNFDPRTGNMYDTDSEHGLTKFGFDAVEYMEELGIIPDVSHLSDKGFYDVLSCTKKPFVASHSNGRALSTAARNLTDDMIRKLAERGGVTGLNYYSNFLKDGGEDYTTLDQMVKQAKHIVNIGGTDVIGLGSDFDGITSKLEIKDCSGMQMLYDALKKEFTESEIEKIFYKNVLRVYEDCLK